MVIRRRAPGRVWIRAQLAGWAILFACALVAFAAGVADAQVGYTSYHGIATGIRNHGFLYGERDYLVDQGGTLAARVVLYTCRNGAPFARKTISYGDPLAPDFVLDDASGMREGIRSDGGRRMVFYRSARDGDEHIGPLPQVPGLVADAGFDEFVRANWQTLLRGTPSSLPFLVPSRLHDINFRVQHERSDQVNGIAVEVFRLKLPGVLGWILPSIDVSYGAESHALMRYVGISDITDASHDNLAVDITFDPGDRRPSTAGDVAAARQTPLAPCG